MSAVLDARDVTIRRGRNVVVHDVNLAVEPGEIVAVLGPNGAGKSTLLAGLGGGLPLAGGTVARPARTATILQTPGLAARSARRNVELALAWSHTPGDRRARAEDALARMRASHLASADARALSGGERRRVHLARAVAVAPEVMLLDEPFDGLDPETHVELRDDLAAALRESTSAVVAVLHDRADAWAIADRIVVLIAGRVQADGPPQQVLDRPPTPEVARFLGYDGSLAVPEGVLLTRPHHVRIDALGKREGSITRHVVVEDGALVRVESDAGTVWARQPLPVAPLGSRVHFSVDPSAPTYPVPARE